MATKSDEKKTAGKDESKTTQTTKQAEENEVPTKVEERGETDAKAAASGGSVGAVRDGDVVGDEDDKDAAKVVDSYEGGEAEGALGTVAERNNKGEEFDAPWTYLTPDPQEKQSLLRTSDSDDPARSWNAQKAAGSEDSDEAPEALVEVQGTPGQTFRVRELPNRAVVEAAGINYDAWVAGLPVRADVPDEAPRKGIPA